MKKRYLPILLNFILISCESDPGEIEFEELNIEQVSEKDCNPEEENCAFISINIPWAQNQKKQGKKINNLLENHVIKIVDFEDEENFGSLEALAQTFIDQYEATAEEFPEYNIPWEASVTGSIPYRSEELLSFQFHMNLFTGGAHGYTSTSYLNINPRTGEKYLNSELFTEDFKDYAEKLFRNKYEIPEGESINSTGFFFDNEMFHLPQNIGFAKRKVILRYNAYEVASYAEGGIKIEVPMEEAEKFLRFEK